VVLAISTNYFNIKVQDLSIRYGYGICLETEVQNSEFIPLSLSKTRKRQGVVLVQGARDEVLALKFSPGGETL
jgi:hypothetical protein